MAESLPPLTAQQLADALANPNFSDYVYFGLDGDKGWKVAVLAQSLIPALRVYRVAPEMQEEIREQLELAENVAGAVFGWDERVRDRLTKSQAGNAMRVIDALQAARKASLLET